MSLFHGLLHRPKPTVGPKPGPTADDGLSDPLGETLADPLDGPQIDDDPTGDPNTAKTLNANTGGDPTGAPDDPGDPDDADVTSYRDRREAAIQEQGNNDQLHTTELSLDKAFPLYREVLAAQGDAVTAPTYERVHAAVNSEAFTAPGKAANASHVDAGAVDRLQTHVLNQYGGGHYALQLHDGIVGYWRPQLIKYEDGEPDKGPLDLFRKKRKEWKRLARNERAQKLEEWGVVKLLHKLFQWKQNKGPRLDEVTWLVESDAEARAAIQAHLANVSVPKPSSIPKQAAPPAPPSYESVADLATYAKALDPHLKLLNGGGFEVAANVKHRKLGGEHLRAADRHALAGREAPLAIALEELNPGRGAGQDRQIRLLVAVPVPDGAKRGLTADGDGAAEHAQAGRKVGKKIGALAAMSRGIFDGHRHPPEAARAGR